MNILIFIIIAVAIFFLIGLIFAGRKKTIKIAYAGSADGKPDVEKVSVNRNTPIFTVGEQIVDLSKYDVYKISGKSLERAGLYSDTCVYTLPADSACQDAMGRFVVFQYDVARQAIEHPEMKVTANSYKARKAVMMIETGLDEVVFLGKISELIERDSEIEDKEGALADLWNKYKFASDFYSCDKSLIVSMTYRGGDYKTYSFHSPRFLSGVVHYKSAR